MTVLRCLIGLMWLGELITEKGIGNGVSLMIFAGIIADFPSSLGQIAIGWDAAKIPSYLLFFALSLFIIAMVVLLNESRRNIPVSYAKRVRGNKIYGGASTYLPMNINPAGVIPIIFALSILMFPVMIANFLGGAGGTVGAVSQSVANFLQSGWIKEALYFFLVVIFTYFYTAVTFNPKSISENLQKTGGFVPGIRPGDSTAKFISYILNRILLIGALFFLAIASLTSLLSTQPMLFRYQLLWYGLGFLIIFLAAKINWRWLTTQNWFFLSFYWLIIILLINGEKLSVNDPGENYFI